MATTITIAPQTVNLAGMPVLHQVQTSEVAHSLKILAYPKSTDTTIGPDAMTPSVISEYILQADFNLMEYYKPLVVTHFYPTLASNAYQQSVPTACAGMAAQFYCYGYNPPVEHTGVAGATLYYVVGKIPRWMQSAFFAIYANFFAWITAISPALTFYPSTIIKKVLPTQPERIYWLQKHAATSLRSRIKLYFTDGTDSGDTYLTPPDSSIAQYTVMAFKAGYTELDVAGLMAYNTGKTLLKYSVTIMAGGNWSEERFYQVDTDYHENTRFLVFRNSLCGYDCLPVTGMASHGSEFVRDIADRTLDNANLTAANKTIWRSNMSEAVSASTGWLNKLEYNWLNELYLSQEVYEVEGTVLTPVIVKGDKLAGPSDDNNLYSAIIEYEKIYYAD